MRSAVRKLVLIAHIIASVGWLGAVVVFLALALAGLTSDDPALVRSAYVAMAFVGWSVIVPFSLAAFLTGLVESVGTEWGLFRHYWVIIKLLLTIGATALLPMHLRVASRLSDLTVSRALSYDDLRGLRVQITGDAAAAVLVLLIATTLSVYKPWGRFASTNSAANQRAAWGRYVLMAMAALVFLAVILHLTGSSMRLH
jgi:hypothetical protein